MRFDRYHMPLISDSGESAHRPILQLPPGWRNCLATFDPSKTLPSVRFAGSGECYIHRVEWKVADYDRETWSHGLLSVHLLDLSSLEAGKPRSFYRTTHVSFHHARTEPRSCWILRGKQCSERLHVGRPKCRLGTHNA